MPLIVRQRRCSGRRLLVFPVRCERAGMRVGGSRRYALVDASPNRLLSQEAVRGRGTGTRPRRRTRKPVVSLLSDDLDFDGVLSRNWIARNAGESQDLATREDGLYRRDLDA
jgi:hypothetical protein